MSDGDFGHLTEEQAAHLWQRAAALQAEAARAAEAASHLDDEDALVPREGYELEHVRSAAIDAGIGAEFLDAALADLRADVATRPTRPNGRFVHFFLGEGAPDSITMRRVVNATPVEVLRSMEELLPKEPFKLSLKDRKGDPLDGGFLVFDIQGAGIVAEGAGFTTQVSAADLREVFVSLRPLEGGATCELTLRGPVAWAHRMNSIGGAVMVGIGSGVGTGLGWLGGTAVSGALLGALGAGGAAAIGAAVTAGVVLASGVLSMKGFRWLYDYSIRQGEKGFDSLLSGVAVHAQGGWGLANDAEAPLIDGRDGDGGPLLPPGEPGTNDSP